MGNQMRYLSKPITDCYFETGGGKSYSYTAASMQGWRKSQEDRFVCVPDFYKDCSFFGVYDGHGGSEIAEFLRLKLHFEVLHFLKTQDDLELALHLGFLACDASITEPENIAELNDMVEAENDGTTTQMLKNQKSLAAAMSQAGEDQWSAGPSAKPSGTQNFFNTGSALENLQRLMQNAAGPSEERLVVPTKQNKNKDSEEMMEVERPLHYLLSDDIEPSDPEDEDYDIEDEDDEESSSTESEEETNCVSTEEFLSSEPGYLSGSTATVAIMQQNRIYIANVGDSRCVLSRKGQAIDMSLDHKPDDPEEKARIIGAGGSVSDDGRVDSCLNLSRAFGDFKFKGNSLVPSQQCITAEPYIKSIDIEKDDDFLIIASDGIWNSMSSQDVVDYINIRLQTGDGDLKDICEEMFKFTLASDGDNDGTGCDNMCCIIIRFGNKGDSFVHKASASNKVSSSDDSLKQEGTNVNAPSSGSAEQNTTDISESTSIDEENSSQNNKASLMVALSPKQSIQHLVKSHWIEFSSQLEKRSENHFIANPNKCNLECKELISVPTDFEEGMSFCEKFQQLEKLINPRCTNSASSCAKQIAYHFQNRRSKEVEMKEEGNLVDTNFKDYLSFSSKKQDLCNKSPSNLFKKLGQPISVRC